MTVLVARVGGLAWGCGVSVARAPGRGTIAGSLVAVPLSAFRVAGFVSVGRVILGGGQVGRIRLQGWCSGAQAR